MHSYLESYSASACDSSLPTLDDQISLALLLLVRLVGRAARPTLPVRRALSEAPVCVHASSPFGRRRDAAKRECRFWRASVDSERRVVGHVRDKAPWHKWYVPQPAWLPSLYSAVSC